MKYLKKFEDAQFTYNKVLSPLFWNNFKFDEKVRLKLLDIANEFYDDLSYDVEILDIVLTGSLCFFNYNQYSDLDVHIIINFKDINDDVELVKKAIDGERFIWNLRHDIKIKGHGVELYIQNIDDPHTSAGLYSLLNDKWIKTPKYDLPTIDKENVNFKYLTYKSGINRLEEISNSELNSKEARDYYEYARSYKKKISASRKIGLQKDGEFSVENLVFKKLRNGKDFGRLIDTITRFYDKIYNDKMFEKKDISKIKIYVDLDGVLTNFNQGVKNGFLNKHNKENDTNINSGWEYEERYGSEEFWKEVKKLGLEFWSNMPWTSDGRSLWNFIKKYPNVEILSKPSKDKLSREGKKIWCKRELGEDVKINLSYDKKEFADSNCILIDDLEKNIKEWFKAGGIGILHKNTKDTIKKLKRYL
ncbi:hypothetical protein M0Q97_01975 [Candidatus Dojkabacteria bacterium]|jgi:hypothetical protein|nr:hypothetical protein [Candidatus Dojkabacteria bacterium]